MVLAAGQSYYLFAGDNRHLLSNLGDCTVDSIVTDPPYELTSISKRFGGDNAAPAKFGSDGAFQRASGGFMNCKWDSTGIAFDPELWAECLRVLKPGGHLLAFSGTRTYHRMAYAIDAAGFEIRDMLSWLYGSGFPKSQNVALAMDKAAGAEREVIGSKAGLPGYREGETGNNDVYGAGLGNGSAKCAITAPVTPEAQQWAGWGTALKPACEPICLARKPLIGTVAGNVAAHGTGAINIDGCRVPTDPQADASQFRTRARGERAADGWGMGATQGAVVLSAAGRFPANVLHDGSDEVLAGFPETTSGSRKAGDYSILGSDEVFGRAKVAPMPELRGDSGSAARFFYCAKASKADREVGRPEGIEGDRFNVHPTVKPTELMRWLVRLVTPPGGLVFDPFTGSGSTGRAAILEGCRFLGAEMTAEYIPIARARIDAAVNGK